MSLCNSKSTQESSIKISASRRKSKRLQDKIQKEICPVCNLMVKDGQNSVCCDNCNVWYHGECINENVEKLEHVKWFCMNCHSSTMTSSATIDTIKAKNDVASKSGLSHSSKHTSQYSTSILLERHRLATELENLEIEKVNAEAEFAKQEQAAQVEFKRKQKILDIKAQAVQRELNLSSRSSNASSNRSQVSSRALELRTSDWVKNITAPTVNRDYGSKQRTDFKSNVTFKPDNLDELRTKEKKVSIPRYESAGVYNYGSTNVVPQQMVVYQPHEKIELPSFDGNPIDWPLFIASYNMSTQRSGYTDVDNLIRLKKALRGKALDSVRGRLFIPSQVPSVIERLSELFGRPLQIIAMIEEKVRKLPVIRENELDGLIQLSLDVDHLCGTIEATARTEYLSNPKLQHQLTEKLPGYLRFKWAEYSEQFDSVNLNTLRVWLNEMSSRASRVVESDSLSAQSHESKSNQQKKQKGKCIVATHELGGSKSNNSEPKPDKLCKICEKENHLVSQCQMFKNLSSADKWKIVFKKGICGKCLGYHNYQKCVKVKSCEVNGCSKKHHPALHNSESTTTNIHVSNNLQHNHASQGVYFRILPVSLHNGERSVSTYAFFDEGSSVTLMDSKLAQQLKLKGPSRKLCLTWTKDIQRTEENSQQVNVEISGEGTQRFRLSDVYTVSDLQLPTQKLSVNVTENENNHLAGIPFPNDENCQPMILIGQNHYQLGIPLELKGNGLNQSLPKQDWDGHSMGNLNRIITILQLTFTNVAATTQES